MARNKVTRYSLYTDLRGKRVELRNGEIVDIPKDWIRIPVGSDSIHYFCSEKFTVHCWQNATKHNFRTAYDIMKVIK